MMQMPLPQLTDDEFCQIVWFTLWSMNFGKMYPVWPPFRRGRDLSGGPQVSLIRSLSFLMRVDHLTYLPLITPFPFKPYHYTASVYRPTCNYVRNWRMLYGTTRRNENTWRCFLWQLTSEFWKSPSQVYPTFISLMDWNQDVWMTFNFLNLREEIILENRYDWKFRVLAFFGD